MNVVKYYKNNIVKFKVLIGKSTWNFNVEYSVYSLIMNDK